MPKLDQRTVSVSEFISFLFKAQLVDPVDEVVEAHPELKGQTGLQLKTFRDLSSPILEDSESGYWSSSSYPSSPTTTSFNRSRFSSDSHTRTSFDSPEVAPMEFSSPVSQSGSGWRVYGSHSRQSSVSVHTVPEDLTLIQV
ncbi:hypothetical protein CPB86DRAFT_131654 [Serendipita vermifera]|nr:hypothetical protein CPB86DRAFT_131654 [Serendipita vermifera]